MFTDTPFLSRRTTISTCLDARKKRFWRVALDSVALPCVFVSGHHYRSSFLLPHTVDQTLPMCPRWLVDGGVSLDMHVGGVRQRQRVGPPEHVWRGMRHDIFPLDLVRANHITNISPRLLHSYHEG